MKTEIDNYLDDCPFFDYSNEKDVHNYAGTFLLWLLKNFFNLLQNSLIQKAKMDHRQLIENPELQNIALYYEEVRKILHYLERKYIVNRISFIIFCPFFFFIVIFKWGSFTCHN